MDELDLIKEKINIVDLIGEYVTLKKMGLNFKAPCPFHQEKTPSFVVSPERQIFKCFGCDKGGDIFRFLMEKESLSFPEAIEILAQRAGVVLKKTTNKKETNIRERIFEANLKATQFYQHLLLNHHLGKKALDYLKGRGLSEETIKEFSLGYAPQNWEILTKFLKKRGFTTEEIVASGLGVASNNGCYDRFRGRIMLPLIDVRNRVLGFSGRIIDVGEPKYVNTPQTAVFDKGRFLFGLNLSKGFIKDQDAIIVEGDLDMIMSYQSGVKNVVSSKGTALTENQIDLIKKYTDTIALCFDADSAGDAANRRGIEMADQAGLNLKVVSVSGAKDPAEVCQNNPDDWRKMVEEAIPIYDFYLASVTRRYNPKQAKDKKLIVAELLPIWNKISDPIVKEHYIEKLSALLQIKDEVIRSELKKIQRLPADQGRFNSVKEVKTLQAVDQTNSMIDTVLPRSRRELLEEYLIALLLHLPTDETFVPNFPETLFTDESLKEIYVMLVLFLDGIAFKSTSFKISEFVKTLPTDLVTFVDRLYLMQIEENLMSSGNWHKELDLVVADLKKMLIKSSLEKLSLEIKNAQEFGNMETLNLLNRRFRDLSVKLKNL